MQQQDFFHTIQTAQQRLQGIKQTAYIVIGPQKSGSSALCNAILRNAMIGQVSPHDEEQVFYVPFNPYDKNVALMGHQYASVTHIPNVFSFQNHSTIIDMPGFGNRRTWKSLTGFWYFLVSCFQKIKKVKFLLTVSETQILSKNIFEALSPFLQFVSLFGFQSMEEETKFKFFKSVVMVVTRAKKSTKIYVDKLRQAINQSQTNKSLRLTQNFQQAILLVEAIVGSRGVEVFRYAQTKKYPDNSDLIKKMEDQSWQSLDVSDAIQQKSRLINIYIYGNELRNLCSQQKQQLQKQLKKKTDDIKDFLQILSVSVSLIQQRWKVCLKQIRQTNYTDLDKQIEGKRRLFSICEDFARKSQRNPLEDQQPTTHLRLEFSLLDSIIALIPILEQLEFFCLTADYQQFIQQLLQGPDKKLIKMVNCIGCFCQTQNQHKLLSQANRILSKQIKSFSILIKLENNIFKHQIILIRDRLVSFCNQLLCEYLGYFFEQVHLDEIINIFKDLTQFTKYQKLFNLYRRHSPASFRITLLQAKRQLFLKNRYKTKAMATNMQILKLACQSYDQQDQQTCSKIYKTIESCICILIDMDSEQTELTRYKEWALQLFTVSQNIFEPLFYAKIINTVTQMQRTNNELELFRKWATGDIKRKLEKVPGVGSIINGLLKIRESLGNKQSEMKFTTQQLLQLSKIAQSLEEQFQIQSEHLGST